MSLSVAEVYMLALRKSMVPIVGEAIPTPFDGQIELDGWSWNLTWSESDDTKPKKDKGKSKDAKPATLDRTRSVKDDEAVVKRIENILKDARLSQEQRNKQVLVKLREAQNERRQDADKGDAADDDSDDGKGESPLIFKFTKNVDLATTQLLNCMKTGEVMPRVVVSLYHRSTNAPLTLIITFKKVTLTDYSCEADVSDTMSDMKESWTAKFEEVDYVYQNRPGAGGSNAVTQGTARVFKMKLKSLF
jgi:type VI protein secretion system component Hcp